MQRTRLASPTFGPCFAAVAGLLLPASVAVAATAGPRYLPAREMVLEYHVPADAVIDDVEVWMRLGAPSAAWERRPYTPLGRTRVRVRVPDDGAYDFYVVLRNEGGASGPPPTAETAPLLRVVVDTSPPLVQIHEARTTPPDRPPPAAGGDPRCGAPATVPQGLLTLRTTIVEEHLADDAVRLFYRFETGDWCDGGPAERDGDTVRWPWPLGLGCPHEMRLLVVDRAGNRTLADIVDFDRPAAGAPEPPPPAAAAEPASPARDAVLVADVQPVTPPPPVRIEPVAPVAPLRWDEPPVPATAPAAAPPSDPARAQELRARAARFAAEGRLDLAAARLEDAVTADPADATARVELGRLLYRLGQIEAAAAQFDAARGLRAEDPGALDGLALVAATQGRYAQARELLLQLRALTPDKARLALRLGDVEHRLGRTDAAVRAWEQARTAPDADAAVRAMARRRLEYFDPGRAPTTAPTSETDGPQDDQLRPAADRRAVRRR